MLPFYSAISKIMKLKRVCPKCKREQIVKPSKKMIAVACKFCAATIPPPKKS